MWAIIKYEKKLFETFKKELKKKIDNKVQFYRPKILLQKYNRNKLINKELDILGDYIFCYHDIFENSKNIALYKYIKGIKYFLSGHQESQKEIKIFIEICKKNEDQKGNLNMNFYQLILDKKYKFLNGPFVEKIFNITSIQKEKIGITIGNIKTNIKYNKYLFSPI